MISYYDIRAARTAMRALQNKPLRRRKLDIHFSIPKVWNRMLVFMILFGTVDFISMSCIIPSLLYFRITHQKRILTKELLCFSIWIHRYQMMTFVKYLGLMGKSKRCYLLDVFLLHVVLYSFTHPCMYTLCTIMLSSLIFI